jgi:Domain of unknown function (DUF4412)
MKIYFFFFLSALAGYAVAQQHKTAFEGSYRVVVQQWNKPNKPTEETTVLRFVQKGTRTLMTPENNKHEEGRVSILMDEKGPLVGIYSEKDGEKTAVVVEGDDVEAKIKSKTLANAQVQKLGQTLTIGEYVCQGYNIDTDQYSITAWVTYEVNLGLQALDFLEKDNGLGLYGLPAGGTPLQLDARKKSDGSKLRLDVTNINAGPVPESTFNFNDYRTVVGVGPHGIHINPRSNKRN